MKASSTRTFAAVVLSAAIASAQTPAPKGGQTPSGGDTASGAQTRYRGYLRGSAATGFTISPITDRRASATATAPGGAAAGASVGTSGTAEAVTYNVVAGPSAKTDLARMADQCVEIVGTLVPETVTRGAGANTSSKMTAAAAAGHAAAQMNRTLTVTRIRAVQGGCSQ